MVARTLKRALYFLIAALGIGSALAALFLLTQTVQKSDDFDRLQDIILAINIAGGILLIALLIGNLTRLLSDYRKNVPGAKLKARMVATICTPNSSSAASSASFRTACNRSKPRAATAASSPFTSVK